MSNTSNYGELDYRTQRGLEWNSKKKNRKTIKKSFEDDEYRGRRSSRPKVDETYDSKYNKFTYEEDYDDEYDD